MNTLQPPAVRRPASPLRVRQPHVDWVSERISARDWLIVELINRLRIVTGAQIERVLFSSLSSPRSRTASRSRALRRLVSWRVVMPLGRRVGGAGRGSSVMVFALDTVGQQLLRQRLRRGTSSDEITRVRRPIAPGTRTLAHALAVAELHTCLAEDGRRHDFIVEAFETEPACWWPNGLGGYLKPDAYARLAWNSAVDHWWVELDMATEALPTVRTKLTAYLDFIARGQLGPHGLLPRVLLAVPAGRRADAVAGLVRRLPEPAERLFAIAVHDRAPRLMSEILRE